MLEQMAAMKVKDDQEAAHQQNDGNTATEASFTHSTTTTQQNSANSQLTTCKSANQAKRQRMDSNNLPNVDVTMVENCNMPGPVRQANQPQ
jgi:hypothetical protein